LFWNKAKKNEYNRSSTIKDLPLLAVTVGIQWSAPGDGRIRADANYVLRNDAATVGKHCSAFAGGRLELLQILLIGAGL
jgi:hypothetical protein